jgi:hypothetical protein
MFVIRMEMMMMLERNVRSAEYHTEIHPLSVLVCY